MSKRARALAPVLAVSIGAATALSGCSPTVRIEPPDKPIQIDLNVKIQQEVRVKVEQDVERLLEKNENLF